MEILNQILDNKEIPNAAKILFVFLCRALNFSRGVFKNVTASEMAAKFNITESQFHSRLRPLLNSGKVTLTKTKKRGVFNLCVGEPYEFQNENESEIENKKQVGDVSPKGRNENDKKNQIQNRSETQREKKTSYINATVFSGVNAAVFSESAGNCRRKINRQNLPKALKIRRLTSQKRFRIFLAKN
ncbi:MAG: hypothetical protein LBT05_14220 [Planctomycetaceae bacterium]|jgi:hypothetical protein|nr:hypothetical protein [Planctomycetaceae bacterium]